MVHPSERVCPVLLIVFLAGWPHGATSFSYASAADQLSVNEGEENFFSLIQREIRTKEAAVDVGLGRNISQIDAAVSTVSMGVQGTAAAKDDELRDRTIASLLASSTVTKQGELTAIRIICGLFAFLFVLYAILASAASREDSKELEHNQAAQSSTHEHQHRVGSLFTASDPSPAMAYMLNTCALGCVYIACSASMIAFNKYLMQPGHFPYPVHLVTLHTGSGFVLVGMFRLALPSYFPSLTGQDTHMPVTTELLWKGIAPIAALSVIYLVLSNWAYMHASVAFLQMMKESNVAFVFIFSVAAGVEHFTWLRTRILTVILIATALTIHGELHFSMLGFMIQGCSQVFESFRIVLQSLLLASAGKKLDVLSFTLVMTPFAFLLLSVGVGFNAFTDNAYFASPGIEEIRLWWPILLANLLLAFSLNLIVATFMQRTSAVACVLVGIVKDASIVLVGCAALHEPLSHMQIFGFSLQLGTIALWSMVKMFPLDFEDGAIRGAKNLLLRITDSPANAGEEATMAKFDQGYGSSK